MLVALSEYQSINKIIIESIVSMWFLMLLELKT